MGSSQPDWEEYLTNSIQSEEKLPDQSEPTSLDLAKNATTILAVTGVVLYGVLAFSSSLFYNKLGVSLSDVGLGYSTILSTSVGVIVLVLIFVSIALVLALSWTLTDRLEESSASRPGPKQRSERSTDLRR